MSLVNRLLRDGPRKAWDLLTGATYTKWGRLVMVREMRSWVRDLDPATLEVLEISGRAWQDTGFKAYRATQFPDYDVCQGPLDEAKFDLIVADQVFEHLLWPYRAGKNVCSMLKPGGAFLVSVPFLVRIHGEVDCTRWTETGLRYFLAECGFDLESTRTGSWGNRACVNSNFQRWARYRRFVHSLRNEPLYPYVVWALARRPTLSTTSSVLGGGRIDE